MKSHRDRILTMAKRLQGVSRADVHDCTNTGSRPAANERFDELITEGLMHPAKRGKSCRYFDTDSAASAFLAAPKPPVLRPITEQFIGKGWRAKPKPAAHVGPPKFTLGPSHPFDARYQVDPETRVVGGFASAGIGRYLDGTA